MKKNNKNLNMAKKNAYNEYYTFYKDIKKELANYKDCFKGKVVYCNCDSSKSQFVKYFMDNFHKLQLKEIGFSDSDFLAPENLDRLKAADIIVTNPPFSLFKMFLGTVLYYNKQFLIVGPFNAENTIYYYQYSSKGRVGRGYNHIFYFDTPSGKAEKKHAVGFTNLKKVKKKPLPEALDVEEKKYQKYSNYDAIEVNEIKNIPRGYQGKMGVSYTIFEYDYEKEFEVIKISSNLYLPDPYRKVFTRVIIKRKKGGC